MDRSAGSTRDHTVLQAGWRQGITLGIAGFLPILAVLALAPAIPTIITHFKDVPNAEFLVPIMATTPGLMVALLSPLAGWISDRYGRRGPMIWATFAYGFLGTLPFFLNDLTAIFISRLLVGVAEAFILTIMNALFTEYFPEDRRRNWLAVQGVMGPLLGAASLAASGWLTSLRWNGVFLIYGLALLIFVAMYAWFYEPDRAPDSEASGSPATPFPWRMVAAYCSVTVFASVLFYVYLVNGGLAFQAIGLNSAARLGALMGLVSLGVVLGSLLFNFACRRWPVERVIILVLLILGVGTAGIGFSRSEGSMVLFSLIQQVGAGMTATTLIFWVSQLLPSEHRGRGFGAWTSAFFIAQFMSPAIVGGISGATGGILWAFAILGLAGVAVAIAVAMLSHRLPKATRL